MDQAFLIRSISETPERVSELLFYFNNTGRALVLNESGLHGSKDDCDTFINTFMENGQKIMDGFSRLKSNTSSWKKEWVIV